ncbi:MAG: sodium:solute symporter [Planctomycetes bacterium]|nr:sodium:solute symporter [Planctomycetota bacterium]MCP4839487.1 sodium:solute symporter [Planctomycetota bacterium]
MFTAVDWLVVVVYLGLVVAIGAAASRRHEEGDDFFLAGRSMPVWAVAVSTLATAVSAATFIGGPQQGFRGDLSYLTFKFAGLAAFIIVGFVFLPAIFKAGTPSVYGLITQRFGASAGGGAAAMFGIGRLLASGARLFMTAIPFSLVAFGDASGGSLAVAIVLVAAAACVYTVLGGVRAVIWTDVLQACVLVGTVAVAVGLLWIKVDIAPAEALAQLDDAGKLRMIDWSLSWTNPYTVWGAAIGMTLFLIAAYGTDQDLAQRLLTCRTPQKAAWAGILSNLIGWPVTFLFLGLGVLLWLETQEHGPIISHLAAEGDRDIFLHFILRDMPTGLRGLMMAGLFAAAMSSLDSALNALAASTTSDIIRPWRAARGHAAMSPARETAMARRIITSWAAALTLFALLCAYWQNASGETLLDFALGVMVFAYAGLLGIFLTALLTPRGNAWSAAAALLVGLLTVLSLQPFAWNLWMPMIAGEDALPPPAFPWRMTIASAAAFGVCLLGKRAPQGQQTQIA